MPRNASSRSAQRFRDWNGQSLRTLSLNDVGGAWQESEILVQTQKEDRALEAAIRPFLADLTVKEREAVAAFFRDARPDERAAGRSLGIDQRSLQKRLWGRDRQIGAVEKVRRALMAAVPPEVREALDADAPGAYAALRRWLTPAERIREDGTEDPWVEADCLVCHRTAAFWRPNTVASGKDVYDEPRLLCLVHL